MKYFNKLVLTFVIACSGLTLANQNGQPVVGTIAEVARPKTIRSVKTQMLNPENWLKKASSDLKSAKELVKDEETLDTAVYHAQQSAEKALKAFLVFKTKNNPHSHDLVELLNLSARINSGFAQFRQFAYDINPYATCHRYPGFECYYATGEQCYLTQEEAFSAIKKAEAMVNFVKNEITLK